jgi:hypothetical protein
MKKFNITAQVMDMCGDNPGQSILYNEVIESYDRTKAEKQFSFDLLVDDIIVQKILSVEEISQVAS